MGKGKSRPGAQNHWRLWTQKQKRNMEGPIPTRKNQNHRQGAALAHTHRPQEALPGRSTTQKNGQNGSACTC